MLQLYRSCVRIVLLLGIAGPTVAGGLHFLGWEGCESADRDQTVRLIKEGFRYTNYEEMEILAVDFSRSAAADKFANSRELFHQVLPAIKDGQVLRLTIDLRHHDRGYTDATTAA